MYDVVIIGASWNGSALAQMLARDGLNSECATFPGETKSGDPLFSVAAPANNSLAVAGVGLLRAANAWTPMIARPEQSPERRLVAIFAADAADYSRLMGENEVDTLRVLMANRGVMESMIVRHRGRIANTAGDSVLAEFPSAVDAVQCAIAVQERLAEANESLPKDRRLQFRIGVHVGEVMIHGGDLFGDRVNTAARLQAFAEPGGLCLSAEAYAHIRKLLPLSFEDIGPRRIKNINEPVGVYSYKARSSDPTSLLPSLRQVLDCRPGVDEHTQQKTLPRSRPERAALGQIETSVDGMF